MENVRKVCSSYVRFENARPGSPAVQDVWEVHQQNRNPPGRQGRKFAAESKAGSRLSLGKSVQQDKNMNLETRNA